LRKRTVEACSQGDGVEVNGLRKRTAAAHSEVEVESVACPGVSDEATTCSRARIEDDRWRWWYDGF
jgi:hypothetical protein